MRNGLRPVVLSGPSGSGKSTLLKMLMDEYPGCFAFSVSHTTRSPRKEETDGEDYFFVTHDYMSEAIRNNEFVEHAEFSGNLYGTSKKAVSDVLNSGKICVLDIEEQGVRSMKQTDLNALYLFIAAPSFEELKKRLELRGSESEESLQRRMEAAKSAMDFAQKPGVFDHILVNDDLNRVYSQLKSVLMEMITLASAPEESVVQQSS